MVEFEWDERKERANFEKHGVHFMRAVTIFGAPVVTSEDRRTDRDYGEQRFISIGRAMGDCIVVVWTPRPGAKRIISAWKGGRKEENLYETGLPGRSTGAD